MIDDNRFESRRSVSEQRKDRPTGVGLAQRCGGVTLDDDLCVTLVIVGGAWVLKSARATWSL